MTDGSLSGSTGARAPTLADIEAAARRIAGRAVRTPMLENHALNDLVGGRVLLKPELLQRTGSFKFRGAFNCVSQIPEQAHAKGVVAFSSGNHAQGVAAAAALLGIPATIVMPRDAPAIKRRNTESLGARVVPYDRQSEDREAMTEEIVAKTGATLVRPFDDPSIIAGQGTIGLEIADQARDLGTEIDAALVPCGGGGLISGTATALKARMPDVQVFAVEPRGWDDTLQSLKTGTRTAVKVATPSICDALLAPVPGELTFAMNRTLLAGGLAVSDDDALKAMAVAFSTLKLVVEPGGAVALGALLCGEYHAGGKTIAVVLSGGNVDPEVFGRALDTCLP